MMRILRLVFTALLVLLSTLVIAQPNDFEAFYSFNNDADLLKRAGQADYQGDLDGIMQGSPTSVLNRLSADDAIYFDGLDDGFTIHQSLLDGESNFTIALWIKFNFSSQPTNYRTILTKTGGTLDQFELRSSRDECVFEAYDSNGTPVVTLTYGMQSANLSDGGWHHLAITVSATEAKMYVDGEVEEEASGFTGYNSTSDSPISVAAPTGSDRYFEGSMDELRFYKKVLSHEEVIEIGDATNFKSFYSVINSENIDATIDSVNHTVDVVLPHDQASNNITFSLHTGATGSQSSPFNSDILPIGITITDHDGDAQAWTINAVDYESDIVSFTIPGQLLPSVVNTTDHTVLLYMPYDTDLSSLTPTIAVSPEAIISPESGVEDFSDAIDYTVTALDGEEQVWTVTVMEHDGKIVSYELDGDATDASVYQNNGTASGTPAYTTDRLGTTDNALTFDGTDDYISTGLMPELAASLNSFSVNFWMRTDNTTEIDRIFGTNSTGNSQYLFATVNFDGTNTVPGTIQLALRDLDGNTSVISVNDAVLVDGDWHMLTLIVNDAATNDIDIYVDGVENTSETVSGVGASNFGSFDNDFLIGALNAQGTPSDLFTGDLDEFEVIDHAIASTEIRDRYEAEDWAGTDILTFSITNQDGSASIDYDAYIINVSLVYGTTLATPTFTLSPNAESDKASGVQQDFSNGEVYTISTKDGQYTEDWTVDVTISPNTETDILTFEFEEGVAVGSTIIDDVNHEISVSIFDGVEVDALAPTITLSDQATISPLSDEITDFTNGVTYTVTAGDGSTTQDWVVSLDTALKNNYVYYPMTGNFNDVSGNDLHGTSSNSPSLTADWYNTPDAAYDFSANNHVINVSNELLNGSLQGTLAAWVKFSDSGGNNYRTIIGKGSGTNSQFGLFCTDSRFVFELYNNGSGNYLEVVYDFTTEGNTDYSDGAWHHIAATFDSNEAKLYVDGELKGTDATTLGVYTHTSNNQFTIGKWGNNQIDSFVGAIDEVFVSNKLMDAAEIEQVMNPYDRLVITEIHRNASYLEFLNDGILPIDFSDFVLNDLSSSPPGSNIQTEGRLVQPDSIVIFQWYGENAAFEDLWNGYFPLMRVENFTSSEQLQLYPSYSSYENSINSLMYLFFEPAYWLDDGLIYGYELTDLSMDPSAGTNWELSHYEWTESDNHIGGNRSAVEFDPQVDLYKNNPFILYVGSPYSPNPTPRFISPSLNYETRSDGTLGYQAIHEDTIHMAVVFDDTVAGFDDTDIRFSGNLDVLTNFKDSIPGLAYTFDYIPSNAFFKLDLHTAAVSVATGLPSNGVANPFFSEYISNEITSFTIDGSLRTDFIAADTSDSDTIRVVMPAGSDVSEVMPTFTLSNFAAEAKVNNVLQLPEGSVDHKYDLLDSIIYQVGMPGATYTREWLVVVDIPPVIASVDSLAAYGESLSISGRNFSDDASVYFGGVKANLTSITNDNIVAEVPFGADFSPISVLSRGLYGADSSPFRATFDSPDIDTLLFDQMKSFAGGGYTLSYADFDLDGKNDLVKNYSSQLYVLRNTTVNPGLGAISFDTVATLEETIVLQRLTVGDFNGDGLPDIATFKDNWLLIYFNQSTGPGNISFMDPIELQTQGVDFTAINTADLNNDGMMEFVLGTLDGGIVVYQSLSTKLDSGSYFNKYFSISGGPSDIDGVELIDADNDGKLDLVAWCEGCDDLSIIKNESPLSDTVAFGTTMSFTMESNTNGISSVAVGDLDGDGLSDLVSVGEANVSVRKNSSTGPSDVGFATVQSFAKEPGGGVVRLGDLNGDGLIDMVASTETSKGVIGLFKNTSVPGAISFETEVQYESPDSWKDLVVLDMDHDGRNEIMGVSVSVLSILMNTKTDKELFSLDIAGQVSSTIKEAVDTDIDSVVVVMPYATSVLALKPDFLVSPGATVSPDTTMARDFSEPVLFTITAEDNTTKEWLVVVEVVANTWDGTSWTEGTPPTATDDAIIAGNYTFSVDGAFAVNNLTVNTDKSLIVDGEGTLDVKGDLTNNGVLTIESGASLITYAGNTISNNILIKRNTRYAGGKYSFVGTPIKVDEAVKTSSLGPIVYAYDESQPYGDNDGLDRWIWQDNEIIWPGKGYAQANQQLVEFTGVPNNGTVTHAGTYTGTANDEIDDEYEGWVLIANPYPAAINVEDFLTENGNIEGAVYIWDDNGSDTGRGNNSDYIVANAIEATNTTAAGGESRYNLHLGSAQGFFVKLKGNGDHVIDFTEDMRVSGYNADGNFFRQSSIPKVRLNLTDDLGLFKQTLIGWIDGVDDTRMNRLYDAPVFDSNMSYGVYSIKQNQPLAIQGVSYLQERITVGYNVAEAGNYQLELDETEFSGALYLRDNLLETSTMFTSSGYEFYSESGSFRDRFELVSSPSEVLSATVDELKMFCADNVLHITLPKASEKVYSFNIIDLTGRTIQEYETSTSSSLDLSGLVSGVYLVKEASSGVSHKIIIN